LVLLSWTILPLDNSSPDNSSPGQFFTRTILRPNSFSTGQFFAGTIIRWTILHPGNSLLNFFHTDSSSPGKFFAGQFFAQIFFKHSGQFFARTIFRLEKI
jgi:hypothetical protein